MAGLLLGLALTAWIEWSDWPSRPADPVSARPDVIVVLGGGRSQRSEMALRLHREFPDVPVLVTGDGGVIVRRLRMEGLPADVLIHESSATSTYENATCTAPLLDALGAQRVLLVTDWFHAPRSLAVFRHLQPQRQFQAAYAPRPAVLEPWQEASSKRERLAVLAYLLRFGINSFRS